MYEKWIDSIKEQSDRRMENIRRNTEERWERWEGQFKPKTKTDSSKGL